MKVILLQDVAKLGRKFSIVSVPDGYALNQLLPKGWAEAATPDNLKRLEKRRGAIEAESGKRDEAFKTAAESLKDKAIKVAVEANEQGHMFAALSKEAIAAGALQLGVTLDPAMLNLPEPIKSLGEHKIELVNGTDKVALTVSVVAKV